MIDMARVGDDLFLNGRWLCSVRDFGTPGQELADYLASKFGKRYPLADFSTKPEQACQPKEARK